MSYVRSRAEREAVGVVGKMLYAIAIVAAVVVAVGAILAIALALWLVGAVIFLAGKAVEALSKGEHGGKTIEVGKSVASTPLRLFSGAHARRD